MVIYKLMAHTNPIDWATPSKWLDIEFYQTFESAAKKAAEMMAEKDWSMSFDGWEVVEIEVLP